MINIDKNRHAEPSLNFSKREILGLSDKVNKLVKY